jgi:hypothetical protein
MQAVKLVTKGRCNIESKSAGSLQRLGGLTRSKMNQFNDFHLFMLEKGRLECADIRRCYGDYMDGELSSSIRGRLDAHIEECPKCQEFSASYRKVVELAGELEDKPISIDVQRRLRAALNKRLGINLNLP